ncbi:sel1 repeat family protein [Bacteroides sp. 51]|uniref:sel1 repeat family protein n=1 Tax=Bacteroides sp. 51 TaxID=2302938 RepID=UPI0013D03157|nr:sel1 repeat family protein [Bacteroides sp. 51]
MMNRNLFIVAILTLFSSFFCANYTHAQECSVSLTGTYKLDSEEGMYDTFVFDGAGKVNIHAFTEFKGDFFQVGDTVIVYPDKSLFVFLKKDEHTLVGISMWVENLVFKRMPNDTIIVPAQTRGQEYANQFYEFYKLSGREEPNLGTYLGLNTDSNLRASMDKLCDEGFPKACTTIANALMLASPGMAEYFRGDTNENKKIAPNKEIFQYYVKAIELNDLDAIAQLGAYFLMLGHKEEAIKVFEKGCELGHKGCCMSLAGLQMNWGEE